MQKCDRERPHTHSRKYQTNDRFLISKKAMGGVIPVGGKKLIRSKVRQQMKWACVCVASFPGSDWQGGGGVRAWYLPFWLTQDFWRGMTISDELWRLVTGDYSPPRRRGNKMADINYKHYYGVKFWSQNPPFLTLNTQGTPAVTDQLRLEGGSILASEERPYSPRPREGGSVWIAPRL